MRKQFVLVQRNNIGENWIYDVVSASDVSEVEERSEHFYGIIAQVPDDKFLVLLDKRLIEALEKGIRKNGYDVPTSDDEWFQVINDLLEEKIAEDFGVVQPYFLGE